VHQHVKDKDEVIDDVHLTPYRLNLAKIGFDYMKMFIYVTQTLVATTIM
jgi:hypothetical protein